MNDIIPEYLSELKVKLSILFRKHNQPFQLLLDKLLYGHDNRVSIDVKGHGKHAYCVIATKNRSARIHIFDTQGINLDNHFIEYFIALSENGQEVSGVHYESLETVLEVVSEWMKGTTLLFMHDKFKGMDLKRRNLQLIQDTVNNNHPYMRWIPQNAVEEEYISFPGYYLRNDERSVKIYYYGNENHPRWLFSWDDTLMFEIHDSRFKENAQIIHEWLMKKVNPTTIAATYPGIHLQPVATYYEEGRGIEGEFILSWQTCRSHYSADKSAHAQDIIRFIDDMTARGYDKKLRAGNSLTSCIVSRSRRHGLREEQKFITIRFHNRSPQISMHTDEGKALYFPTIEPHEALLEAFDHLCTFDID